MQLELMERRRQDRKNERLEQTFQKQMFTHTANSSKHRRNFKSHTMLTRPANMNESLKNIKKAGGTEAYFKS